MAGITIKELCEKHGLPALVVREVIERVVSGVLTNRMGFEIEARFDQSGKMLLRGYKVVSGQLDSFVMPPSTIRSGLIREIMWRITESLVAKKALNDHKFYSSLGRTIVRGMIVRIITGDLIVELKGIGGGETLLALCAKVAQTPKEREFYSVGMTLPFFCMNVLPISRAGVASVEVRLSRNSRGLAEGLMKVKLMEKGIIVSSRSVDMYGLKYIWMKCTRRIAGALSEFESSEKLPREIIKSLSDELKEKIVVRFGENRDQGKKEESHASLVGV